MLSHIDPDGEYMGGVDVSCGQLVKTGFSFVRGSDNCISSFVLALPCRCRTMMSCKAPSPAIDKPDSHPRSVEQRPCLITSPHDSVSVFVVPALGASVTPPVCFHPRHPTPMASHEN